MALFLMSEVRLYVNVWVHARAGGGVSGLRFRAKGYGVRIAQSLGMQPRVQGLLEIMDTLRL